MRNFSALIMGTALLAGNSLLASEPPRGNLLELHSCELYAGGCIVSSEATLGGRYMLRAWQFTGGDFAGAPLAGLQVAVLQSSSENLAAAKTDPGQAVVYLPESATAAQRETLLGWLKVAQPELSSLRLHQRIVPLHFARTDRGFAFTAGDVVSVESASMESCEMGGCGESLWYTPRSSTSVFTVAVDRSSHVTEPLLKLKWDDSGKRSIFLGKFGGDSGPAKELYVTSADLCGPTGKLF